MTMINISEYNEKIVREKLLGTKKVFSRYTKEGSYYYYNIECGFDIETTSLMVQDRKSAFMYVWMFGIKDTIFYGRTWEELLFLLKEISKILELNEFNQLICYIHNMGYEFQFMQKYFNWTNVFAVDERKPIKASCDLGIEFRDSYILSGMSLDKTAENLTNHKIEKLVGNLDYDLIRTQDTVLSDKELSYCENDVRIILAYINEQMALSGDIAKIPLTNTGRVRKYVGDNCYYTNKSHKKSSSGKYKRYSDLMKNLQVTEEDYKMLKRAFQGGYTHANANHVNKVIENVSSYDFTSSYPACMLSEKYPMSSSVELKPKSIKEFNEMRKKYCLVFDVEFTNIISTFEHENYISESKCMKLDNKIVNNGRVVKAEKLVTTITNVDFDIIEQTYKWDKMAIGNVIGYYKNFLPKPIIESVLNLYEDKTTLKGVEDKEVEYMLSKGMLNSTYGMSVTDIVKEVNTYNNVEWIKEPSSIEDDIKKYNKSKKRFLYYPWGVFITAYARRNLWSGILAIKEHYIYSDTDSIKCYNSEEHKEYFEKYNRIVLMKMGAMCEYYDIDKERLKPKNIYGVDKEIGIWDYEGTYSRFKTLGAKRYLVEEDGNMFLTVAGLSKKNGIQYMSEKCNHDNTKVFNMFNDNLYIPPENTGKMTHTYIDDPQEYTVQDYQGHESHILTKTGIHLSKCDFTLSISIEYGTFIKKLLNGEIYKGVSKYL